MKRKDTLEEKEVRKKALKMTAVLIATVVAIEAVVSILMYLGFKYLKGIAVSDTSFVCAGLICFDIVIAIAAYFDFKKEVAKWQNKSK